MVKNILINLSLINQKHFIRKLYLPRSFTKPKMDFLDGNLSDYWQNSASSPILSPASEYSGYFRSWIPEQSNGEVWGAVFLRQKFRWILQEQKGGSRKSPVPKLLKGSQSGTSIIFIYGDPARHSYVCTVYLQIWQISGKLKMELPGQNI